MGMVVVQKKKAPCRNKLDAVTPSRHMSARTDEMDRIAGPKNVTRADRSTMVAVIAVNGDKLAMVGKFCNNWR